MHQRPVLCKQNCSLVDRINFCTINQRRPIKLILYEIHFRIIAPKQLQERVCEGGRGELRRMRTANLLRVIDFLSIASVRPFPGCLATAASVLR